MKLEGLGSEFRLTYQRRRSRHVPVACIRPGIHNVRNAAAAAAVALYLNVPAELIREGLAKFSGVGRRFDVKGVVNDITVIDDYGHHPVEIRATLEAARAASSTRSLVLFQPHRYSRTQHLWDDFSRAFNLADVLVLTDIYAASEAAHSRASPAKPSPTPFARPDTRTFSISGRCKKASSTCCARARPGDAILTIGAGNVSRASNELMVLLGTEHSTNPCALIIPKSSRPCRS